MNGRERIINVKNITSERAILAEYLEKEENIDTSIERVKKRKEIDNTISQDTIGLFRSEEARKGLFADVELTQAFMEKGLTIPSFMEAGPRKKLMFDPRTVRVAVVTTGGIAPGLNCVVHSIVKRHIETYDMSMQGKVFGVYNSFKGLCNLAENMVELNTEKTEKWLAEGGSKLGVVRFYYNYRKKNKGMTDMARMITQNLKNNRIDILYVIGGDGSLKIVNEIAKLNPTRSIVGIPKTMDNDLLWAYQSFGFDTAVEQAACTINTLKTEAESTRRICLIELFGAESGFVAAHSALASVHVNAVLIPEVFIKLTKKESIKYLNSIIDHIAELISKQGMDPYAVVIIAEGVGEALNKNQVTLRGKIVTKSKFLEQLADYITKRKKIVAPNGDAVPVFMNEPRHNIRAVPANSHDEIYCERLGALAVDNALAGYTNFMISNWLTQFVLVPTHLVTVGKKGIPVKGLFWKQVVNKTRQPLSPAEIIEEK